MENLTTNQFATKPFGSLSVSYEEFKRGMSVELTDDMVKSLRGFDYLNIAHAILLLKQHFPTLTPIVFIDQETALPFFDLPDGRGTLIGVYILDVQTGAKSNILWYPVMGVSKGKVKPAVLEPDSRQITDNIARATVKCIAYVTGLGFSLYSQIEAIDLILSEGGEINEDDDDEPPVRKKTKKAVVEEEDEDDYEDDEDEDEDEDEEEVVVKPKYRSPKSGRKESLLPSRRFRK